MDKPGLPREFHIMANHGQIAFDTIDEIEASTDVAEVADRFSAVLHQFGYTSFLIADSPETTTDIAPLALLNGWPHGWFDEYNRRNFFRHDPMLNWMRRTVDPFEWTEVPPNMLEQPNAQAVMDAAKEFRLRNGFVVPIVRTAGMLAAVTLAGERPETEPRVKRALHLLGMYAHNKSRELHAPDDGIPPLQRLSQGERDVLSWLARGKTTWEISEIIHLSERGVIWRLNNALKKLDAVNRTQAVVMAMRTRQINP
jgi:LuxR family quorum sensing-dependent transcriptional regulator